MAAAEVTNAQLLSDISVLSDQCTALLSAIDDKPKVRGFRYVVPISRKPLEGGFDVRAVDGAGGAAAAAVARAIAGRARAQAAAQAQMNGRQRRQGAAAAAVEPDESACWLEIEVPGLEVHAQPIEEASTAVLERERFDLGIKPIMDFFNDKLDYT
jgi:hypothetical protein